VASRRRWLLRAAAGLAFVRLLTWWLEPVLAPPPALSTPYGVAAPEDSAPPSPPSGWSALE
jgi:hypothetical protein